VVATAVILPPPSGRRTLNTQPSAGSYCSRNRLVTAPSWLTAVYILDKDAVDASRTHADTVNPAVVSRTGPVVAYASDVPSRLSSPPARRLVQAVPAATATGRPKPERSTPVPSSGQ
jgi:hypothetical protein